MAQNGAGIPGANAAMYGGMNGSIMPSAGHYSDMQTLMQNMETLSGWLQQNREEWGQVQEGLGRVERLTGRLPREELQPLMNGDGESHQDAPPPPPSTTSLQLALSAAHTRIADLEATMTAHSTLQTLYEETLSDATERIRNYTYEQQTHVLSLHKHYTTLLAQSRNETIEAQVTHQEWQGRLLRLSEGVRGAMKAREEEGRPWVGRVRGLREENRVLRRMVGWEDVGVDSEDEEEAEGEAEMARQMVERGRGGQLGGGQGGGGMLGQEGGS